MLILEGILINAFETPKVLQKTVKNTVVNQRFK